MKNMRLVQIEWFDACGPSDNWEDLEDCDLKPHICRSAGWLLHDGENCKVIVPHTTKTDNYGCGNMTIPVTAIIKIVDLLISDDGT